MCAKRNGIGGGGGQAEEPGRKAALENLKERRRELSERAAEDYVGQVMNTAAETVTAKVKGRPPDDPDGRRLKRRERDRRIETMDLVQQARAGVAPQQLLERTVGTSEFLNIDYFVKGLVAARSIGRLDALGGAYFGSGFICAPGMVMTNHHVLPSPDIARLTDIGFETYDGVTVVPRCDLAPDAFWWTDGDLDISIVALDPERAADLSDRLGWHPLFSEQGKVALGDPTGIIQYPQGRQKSVVVHDSTVIFLKDDRDPKIDQSLWYRCDTEPGSSGSPVFNKHWEIVAVHHASVPARDKDGDYIDENGEKVSEEDYERDPSRVLYMANKGIRASRIVAALKAEPFKDSPGHLAARDAILEAWQSGLGQSEALFRMRRRIAADWAESVMEPDGANEPAFRFDPALEASRAGGRTVEELVAALLERAGPGGRVNISVKRGDGS